MIRLTFAGERGGSVYVNPAHIVAFYERSNGVTVVRTTIDAGRDARQMEVREMPERIVRLIEDSDPLVRAIKSAEVRAVEGAPA